MHVDPLAVAAIPHTFNVRTSYHKCWISHCHPPFDKNLDPSLACTQGYAKIRKLYTYSHPLRKLKVAGWQHCKSMLSLTKQHLSIMQHTFLRTPGNIFVVFARV